MLIRPAMKPILVTIAQPQPPLAETSLWEQAISGGPIVLGVLILLVLMSVGSWAIIIYKQRQLSRGARQSASFVEAFWKARRLDELYNASEKWADGPVTSVFRSGYLELTRVLKAQAGQGGELTLSEATVGMDSVERALRRQASAETTLMESFVNTLATTGSTAPFIGLFGTVWGIMTSFADIAKTGSASLNTVAPGISHALIATAAGLAAAIPAVIAFNYFAGRIRVLETEMANFSADFLNVVERHVLKQQRATGRAAQGGMDSIADPSTPGGM